MATVSMSPAQQRLGSATKRRVPLGNVTNGANSPFRTAAKRSRDQVEAQEDFPWDGQPTAKRQIFELERPPARASPRKHGLSSVEDRVFSNKRPSGTPPTPFERQLLALKEDKPQQRVDRQERSTQQAVKGIKQWQEHYKRAFPSFVFYFENIGEESRSKCAKYARSLGAREEKFFSKDVTHVITLREIPADVTNGDAADIASISSISTNAQAATSASTIHPSVPDRGNEIHGQATNSKSKFSFEAATNRRAMTTNTRDTDQRRNISNSTDVLVKAKELGIKVWQLEKFQRMIRTMHETPAEIQPQQSVRSKASNVPLKAHREPELSRMLRNERINGPSDRDSTSASNETVLFKGPYIYIRDIDERTKPILVREYAKPAKGEMGAWPQFQAVGAGRCPFVPEITKEDVEKVKPKEAEQQRRKVLDARPAPVTRSAVQRQDNAAETPSATSQKVPLRDSHHAINVPRLPPPTPPQKAQLREFCPPPLVANKSLSIVQIQKAVEAQANPPQRLFGGEPAASGLQQSNITSAIRSQMISSTAAQPGAKAGTSKEFHGLQRKVLEKNNAPTQSANGRQAINPTAIIQAGRVNSNLRQTRMQVQQVMRQYKEQHRDESTESEAEDVWLAEGVRKTNQPVKKPCEEKEVKVGRKVGYCENCKEKYDDFDEHVVGRKHRKFALTKENWADLDRLLSHLGRPLKEPDSGSF